MSDFYGPDDLSRFGNNMGNGRRKFIAKVYSLVTVYITLTCIQILPVIFRQGARDFLNEQRYLIYIVLIFFIMTILLFFNFREIRMIFPYNAVILFPLLESATFVVMIMVAPFSKNDVGAAFGITVLICIVVTFTAATIPFDFTKQVLFLTLLLISLFISCIFIIFIAIFVPSRILTIIFSSLAVAGVVLFSIYHSQTIFGGRLAQIRDDEHLYSSIIIYVDFFSLFIVILILFEPIAMQNVHIGSKIEKIL